MDSVEIHARAWQDAFQHFGKNIELSAVQKQIGKGGDHLLPTFLTNGEIQLFGEKLKDYRSKCFKKEYMHKVEPFASVRALFEKIIENGKRVAVGSSAHEEELQHYLDLCSVQDLVSVTTCADDADRSKPDPDIFEAALLKLGETPSRTLVVGDSPYDAEAANKIGIQSIGFLCGGFEREWLEKSGMRAIYKNPADLLQKFDDSPLRSSR